MNEGRNRPSAPNTYEMKRQESKPLEFNGNTPDNNVTGNANYADTEAAITSTSIKPKQDRCTRKVTLPIDLEHSDEHSQSQPLNGNGSGWKSRLSMRRMSRKSSIGSSFASNASNNTRRRSSVHETARCLDGHKRRSISAKTEILRTREQMNHLQRMKTDRAINIMLITVSVSFLVLTMPYQIIWVTDRIFEFVLKTKIERAQESEYSNEEAINRIKREYGLYQLISYSLKDITLVLRNLNFSINFFLYSTMSNLFRQELNCILQNLGLYSFKLFKNELSTSTVNSDFGTLPSARSRILSLFSTKGTERNTTTSRV